MSRRAIIERPFADGRYSFRLGVGELELLQEATDCGPMELQQRLLRGLWRQADVRETLRLGLIGGGMQPEAALTKIEQYVDAYGLAPHAQTAMEVVGVALFGAGDEQPGEPDAEAATDAAGA